MTTSALLFLAAVGWPSAAPQEGAPARVTLTLATEHRRALRYDLVPFTLTFSNDGVASVPCGEELLAGFHGGARLVLRVTEVARPDGGAEGFVPEPRATSDCAIGVRRALPPGQERTLDFALGAKTGPRLAGGYSTERILVPAFGVAGAHVVEAVYTLDGVEHVSNAVRIEVSEPTGRAQLALERLVALGPDAYWLYATHEISMDASMLAEWTRLAEDFPGTLYGDLAELDLARHHARLAWVHGHARGSGGEHPRLGLEHLDRISSRDFKLHARAAALRATLERY